MNNNIQPSGGHDLRSLYRRAAARLSELGSGAPEHEALLLCVHCLDISGRADIALRGDTIPAPDAVRRLAECVEQRASRPLQYILGEWDFCSMTLAVGEGVLIPRDDTAALVETVAGFLSGVKDRGRILDLCAGSGAVGLACARALPGAEVICLELSDGAMHYLEENVRRWGDGRVSIVKGDVLRGPGPDVFPVCAPFDVICSNPPYIRTGDIAGLAREVRQEPVMALDGGEDGLVFYRAIAEKWSVLLGYGGALAFETGDGMENAVAEIMRSHGFCDIMSGKDINGRIRTIIGTKRK